MKNKFFILAANVLVLFSCSAIKEAITVPVNTSLSVDVPLSVNVTKSAGLSDKAGTIYSFSAEKVLQVADNVDVKSYINKLKSVDLKGVTVNIVTLNGTEEVLTLDVSVSGINGPIFSKTNITATNNNPFSPVIAATVQTQINLVAAKILADRQLTITVSGTTNAAPLSLTAKLAFDARFICMPLN
jgi:hypothetical protein